MKKRGFTLIELLAVIVVLAIIALIATPIVMNTIKNSKKGAAERGADNYIKQVETTIAEKRLENNPLSDGTYTIDENGNLTGNGLTEPITIEMNGTKPSSGSITISNGEVTTSSIIGFKDYEVKYNTTNKKYEATAKGSTSQVEVLCTAKTAATTGNVPSGNYAYGDEYTCELGDNDSKTFFVLEESGDNVSLIMDKNIDSNGKGTTTLNIIDWISKADYIAAGGEDLSNDDGYCQYGSHCSRTEYGPITAEKYLKNSTTSWTKLTEAQISLPSANQLATASGKTFDVSSTSNISGLPTWLYGNLSNNANAYWTSTPCASVSVKAWRVDLAANLTQEYVENSELLTGVRSVITISKSQLG